MTPTKLRLPQFLRSSERRSLSMYLMAVGLVITVFFVAIAILAPAFQSWGWLQDPMASLINPIHEPPGAKYWFGTSRQGYDVLSRSVFGSQAALQVVILATTLSLIIGRTGRFECCDRTEYFLCPPILSSCPQPHCQRKKRTLHRSRASTGRFHKHSFVSLPISQRDSERASIIYSQRC
jgi:hypothetical protein